MAFKLGLRGPDRVSPQKVGKHDWSFDALGLPGGHGQGADLTPFVVNVLNQGNLGSCVANAWEQALRIEARRRGWVGELAELGSRLFGYFNARAETGDERKDAGTYLRTYAAALSKNGRCAESIWPYRETWCNDRPSDRAYQRAKAMKGLRGYFRIFDQGDRRIKAIKDALDAGHPVVFGTLIDSDFMVEQGPSIVGVPSLNHIEGPHALLIVGYRIENGKTLFKVLNSWGEGWRDAGFVEFTEEYIVWAKTEDLWVASLV